MNGKDVYVLGLSFHGVSDVQVNIPNFYNYPAFHEALWEYRADRSNVEKRDKQLKLGENGLYIERWNRHYEKYKILPDSLWLEGYTDRDEPLPHELIFSIISGGIVVRKPLADILNKHRLGQTTLTPVQIYDYHTRQRWSDEVFYFLNICEHREYACHLQSNQDLKPFISPRIGKMVFDKITLNKDNQVELYKEVVNCNVDLWYDPICRELFISFKLYHALGKIGLKHGINVSDTFVVRAFKCKLV